MGLTRSALQRKKKKELIDAILQQGGSEKAPLWEISSLVDYKFFLHEDAETDIELEPKGTAVIPEHMRVSRDVQKAVQDGIITEPYQVEEPTPARIRPTPPAHLRLNDAKAKEAVNNILACNQVGWDYIHWGADVEVDKLKRDERVILRERLLPIYRLADWYDKQMNLLTIEYRTALHERIKQVEAF